MIRDDGEFHAERAQHGVDGFVARMCARSQGLVEALPSEPGLLDMLDLEAAIVSIDAMGTQKATAAEIVEKGADYVLALKGNQSSLHEDAKPFFADPVLAAACAQASETDAGHGRIEERLCRAADAGRLAERHPAWKGLRSIAAITESRIDKRSGAESLETRFYITSLAPEPKAILDAVRAHWGIENNLHWTLDVIFDEDRWNPSASSGPQGQLALEPRHRPPCRLQHRQSRQDQRLAAPQPPQGLLRPWLPIQALRQLTI